MTPLVSLLLIGALPDTIRVEQGLVSGTAGKSPEIRVFRGIPYAAPPQAELRWKPPQAPAAWQGVRKSEEFGSSCMQTPYAEGSIYRSNLGKVSEDCLNLNVWTPAKSARDKLPVMVWIHGGAFTRGSGSTPVYDGEALARKGVVLVTINYRLGVFGFFAHPELTREMENRGSANQGIMDQIAALRWVQKNIANFGGDPGKVTIFGESAGSWAVCYLMATPLAKGLFHRVIGESGAAFNRMTTLAESERAGERVGKSLADLRAKSAEEVLKTAGGMAVTRPVVDGWMLPEEVRAIFGRGKQNDVPLIVGFNADEGTAFATWPLTTTAAGFAQTAKQRYGERAAEYLKIYPAETDEQAKESYLAAWRDQTFGWQMRTWARAATGSGRAPVFAYYFTRVPPGPSAARFRSYHAAEIAYVFGNLYPPRPWEEVDRKLAEAMSEYWANFAKNGNPNGGKTPVKWPQYDEKKDEWIEFGDSIRTINKLHKAAFDFLDTASER